MPFAAVDLYLVESQDSVSISHVVLELAFVAEAIGVVKHSVSVLHVSFALAVVFQLCLAISHAKFVVVVGVLKHFIQVFLTICPFAFYFAGCGRPIVSTRFALFVSTFALLCTLFYL